MQYFSYVIYPALVLFIKNIFGKLSGPWHQIQSKYLTFIVAAPQDWPKSARQKTLWNPDEADVLWTICGG